MERLKAKHSGLGKRNRNRLLFYCAFLSLPVLQFCIFYIGVNFNSFLLAFKSYEYETGAYQWVGFTNFKDVFSDFASVLYMQASIRNSLMLYAFTMLTTFLALLFSYYIFKRAPLSRLFQTMLFIPNIISAIVMVTIFKYFVERAIPAAWEMLTGQTIEGLLGNQKTTLGTLIGLLGTVLGMIRSFSAMASGEGGADSAALSTGISEALVNTASGIATGALSVISYNYYTNKIDRLTFSLDEVGFSIVQTFSATH